jgi:hypothetical protein
MPLGNLVDGMKWFQGAFTQRLNARKRRWGHVFSGRYKAKIVDEDPAYFRTAALYILLNPVEAGLINLQKQDLAAYAWSSYPDAVKSASRRPSWLSTARLFESVGIDRDTPSSRKAFSALMLSQGLSVQLKKLSPDDEQIWQGMQRGWVHGSRTFRKAMTKLLEDSLPDERTVSNVEQRRDSSEASAEQALKKALKSFGIKEGDLKKRAKGDEDKQLLAGWLRYHYPVSCTWCSDRLYMGHRSLVSKAAKLYRETPRKLKKKRVKLERILQITT